MIINKTTKGYQTRSDMPNGNWMDNVDWLAVPDDSDLAAKVRLYAPYMELVLDAEGDLVDVTPTERTAPTEAELTAVYEALVVQKIRQQYSADDEYKILREALALIRAQAYPDDAEKQAAFSAYNAYVEECKAEARADIYGGEAVI